MQKYILEVWNDRGFGNWLEIEEHDSEEEALKAFESLHSSDPQEWRVLHRTDRLVRQGKSRPTPCSKKDDEGV